MEDDIRGSFPPRNHRKHARTTQNKFTVMGTCLKENSLPPTSDMRESCDYLLGWKLGLLPEGIGILGDLKEYLGSYSNTK